MRPIPGFSNARHNVFVSGNANVTVDALKPDTGLSYFMYLSLADGVPRVYSLDGSGVAVPLEAPLFVPLLAGIDPLTRPSTPNATFTFSGSNFFPCGMKATIYMSSVGNEPQVS
jgi:hypothetical protein